MEKNRRKIIWNQIYKKYATQITLLLALLVLGVILSFASPYFLSFANFMNIGVAIAVPGTLAAGLTVSMIMGCIDLSQYAVMAFTGIVTGMLMERNFPPAAAIGTAVLMGLAIGAVNAFLVTNMYIESMIATIAMQLMCRAGAYLANNSQYVKITNPLYNTIGFGRLLGIPIEILIMLLVFVMIGYMLKNTVFGRQVYAVGGNAQASELAGIDVKKMKFLGFVISGAAAGLGAVLLCAQVGSAMPSSGTGNEMDGITAVFLGGVAFTGGKGYVWGTLIGVLLLQVLSNGMTLLGMPPFFQQFIKGLVLLASVYSDVLRGRKLRMSKGKA